MYNDWQYYVKKKAKDKKAYDDAKEATKARKKEAKAADRTYTSAMCDRELWRLSKNATLSEYGKVKKDVDEKVAELKVKKIELAANEAVVELALGSFSEAKKKLTDVRDQYPDAWEHALSEDADLKRKIEEVLNYETGNKADHLP